MRCIKKLLITIPSYNEQENLPSVLEDLKSYLPQIKAMDWDCRIVIIDDGSADDTAKAAKKEMVNVIRLPVNLGYGAALQTGFKYAVEQDFDAVLSIDADGQHQPKDILKLLETFNSGDYDVILGSRFVEDTGYKTNWSRRLGIKMFSVVLRLLSGKKIADVTTGFQLLSRPVVQLFATEYPHDYPDAQVLLLLSVVGFRIAEVPVFVRERIHGESMHSSIKALLYPLRNILAIAILLLRVSRLKGHVQSKKDI